jgi:U3 small nucleolar RNA-associated protein 7
MSFDKKIHDQLNRVDRINKVLNKDLHKTMRYLDTEGDGFMQTENENEKLLKISQNYLKHNMPKYNKDNIFDLNLNYGSYYVDFTQNGSHLLLAGEKGHISMIEWKNKNLLCELNLGEKIRAAKFLHNETMFAVAQRKKLYIYDRQGIELHALDYHQEPKLLEYLPYHFLLVSALKNK